MFLFCKQIMVYQGGLLSNSLWYTCNYLKKLIAIVWLHMDWDGTPGQRQMGLEVFHLWPVLQNDWIGLRFRSDWPWLAYICCLTVGTCENKVWLVNRPFYNCVLSYIYLAHGYKQDWRLPCFSTDLPGFLVQMPISVTKLDLHNKSNKVFIMTRSPTASLPFWRPGHWTDNCKIVYSRASFFPFVFQMCQFVLKPVISGLRPAKMIRFVWKMFSKTITSLFMVKTSALQIKPA